MTEWREVPLGELGDVVTGGTPPARNADWFGEETPFITPTDIGTIDRRARVERRLSAAGRDGLRKKLLPPGTVCFVCIGATIGKLCLTDAESVTNQQINSIVPNRDVDGRCLYYLLRHEAPRIAQMAGGAATPIINKSAFANVSVLVPDFCTQARIGLVLGALDDLIENNRRRVEILEEMAKAIYREWFVRFGYPGHEADRLVDSPLGPIPDGWVVKRLQEVASLVRGRSYRKSDLVEDGGRPFINLKCMMRGGGFRRDGIKRYEGRFLPEQVVRAGDVVLAVTDLTQGREILARATLVPRLKEDGGIISLDVARVVPREEEDRLWIFAALRWSDFAEHVKEYANGSTVLHLSPTHVAQGLMLWPPTDIRDRYSEVLSPILSTVDELSDSIEVLVALRDKLLPKLVTGQIDVSRLDLNAVIEASA